MIVSLRKSQSSLCLYLLKNQTLSAWAVVLLLGACAFALSDEPNHMCRTSEKIFSDKASLVYAADDVIVKVPIIENGKVVLRTRSGLETFELETAKKLWTYQTEERAARKPFIMNGIVYFCDGKRILCAFEVGTGKQIWKKNIELIMLWFEPVVCDDRIYLTTSQKVLALDVKTGETIWSVDDGPFGMSPVLIGRKLVIFSLGKSSILQIDRKDGQVLLEQDVEYVPLVSALVNNGNYFYYYGYRFSEHKKMEEVIVCLSMGDGSIVWQMPFDEEFYVANHTLNLWKNHLYVFAQIKPSVDSVKKPFLRKMDAKTGRILWTLEFDNMTVDGVELVFRDDILFFSDKDCIYAVSTETGKVISKRKGKDVSQVTTAEGLLFWGEGRRLFTLDCTE